ncbi:MAG: hypothetical protein ACE5KM_07000 [Planctomycetaceae bacterium]
MTIEFHCASCNKLLRTADDKAGKRARCPDCGETITVPAPDGGDGGEGDDFGLGDFDAGDERYGEDPSQGEAAGGMKNCPMCGAQIRAAAVKCRHCGEVLGGRPQRAGASGSYSTQIEAGEVIGTSWEIFKRDMGILIGGFLVLVAVGVGVGLVFGVLETVAVAAIAGGPAPQQPFGPRQRRRPFGPQQRRQQQRALWAQLAVSGVALPFRFAIQIFLQTGFTLFLVNVARGRRAQIGDIFAGGPYFFRMLGSSILFVIALYIGLLLCIAPGIIFALMFWPYSYLIIDQDMRAMESFGRAKEMTEGNWGAVFLIALASIGINILGLLACFVGLIFTAPLTSLMMAVAYCRMLGVSTAAD